MSSSTTRLTKEFRYLLDMINIVRGMGWVRVAANSAGVRGRGQGSAGRPTAQRRGLDAGTGRRILSVAGPPVRGGERAMLLGRHEPLSAEPSAPNLKPEASSTRTCPAHLSLARRAAGAANSSR